jgi:SAM-dependent methyltransferase
MQRLWFNLWYLFKPPWDTGITPPEVVRVIEEENYPRGCALELGCGTGTNVLYLARHGFDVVGVDFAPRAIAQAKKKLARAGLSARLLVADVTRLDSPHAPRIEGPFDFALDIGCFHAFDADGRTRYAASLARRMRSGGTYMLFAFKPGAGRVTGINPEEVAQTFGASFRVASVQEGEDWGVWYRLEKR